MTRSKRVVFIQLFAIIYRGVISVHLFHFIAF